MKNWTKKTWYITAISLLVVFMCTTQNAVVFAHGDEVHESEDVHLGDSELKRMEKLVQLLNEMVLLLQALKIQQGYETVNMDTQANTDSTNEMDEHNDEHAHEDTSTTEPTETNKLIIEVETHNEKTHVHTRYVDKPEDMYFVDAPIDDEEALIEAIKARTGLSHDEIKEALVYFE